MIKYVNIKMLRDGGFTCGPWVDDNYAEIEIEKENSHEFVLVCDLNGFEGIMVLNSSVIEIFPNAGTDDSDKIYNSAVECFEDEETKETDINESEYCCAIKLGRLAVKAACESSSDDFDDIINDFNSKYRGVDLDSLDFTDD